MPRKGPEFEREFCRDLSRWYTKGAHDDWFWRTHGSGGRATTRAKKGKSTFGQDGDVCATHPQAQKLIDSVYFELKRGYANARLHDVLDWIPGNKQPLIMDWVLKAQKAVDGINRNWVIVHRRDRRGALVYSSVAMSATDDYSEITAHGPHGLIYFRVSRLEDAIKGWDWLREL